MDHPRGYLGLHTVTMLRDLIRKWWQVDIGFADASGRLLDATWGAAGTDAADSVGNDFCRALLAHPEGRRRCLASVREIHRRLRREPELRGPLTHSCHLGLQMAAGPVHGRDRYRGFVFACGYSSRELSRTRIGRLRGTVHDILGRRGALEGDRVPVLGREDTERMKDLLAYGAREMAAFEHELARREASEVQPAGAFAGLVARAPASVEILGRLRKLAQQSCPILLQGEPGVGKRVLASAVHQSSGRSRAPFLRFASTTDPLVAEAKLFGQVRRGSLGQVGLLESARGGTVYLAPDSWRSGSIQVKLLRLLQESTVVPVGADRPLELDVRLILGLREDADSAMERGWLRRDLAGWLGPYTVRVPPLRERIEDIEPLALLFIQRHVPDGNQPPDLHPEALAIFQQYQWPANATSLEEEIRSLLTVGNRDGMLMPEGISARIREHAGHGTGLLTRGLREARTLKEATEILERELILEGLARTGWNKSMLARQLGISRSNLLAKIDRYNLESTRSGPEGRAGATSSCKPPGSAP